MTALCPICRSKANFIENYSRQKIINSLQKIIKNKGIHNCKFGDYEIFQCQNCGVQFSSPMVEPDANFYTWVTNSVSNYPKTRWEWFECINQLALFKKEFSLNSINLLDIGCGSGSFMQMLNTIPSCNSTGIDINNIAIETCKANGLNAICGSFEEVLSKQNNRYNAITLWHVVEHVANPVDLLIKAKELLTDDGRIYFSVPISPLSYETSWADPLNAPPHHLTRWQVSSIEALALRLDMSLQLSMPPADSLGARLLRTLVLQSASPYASFTRFQKSIRLLAFLCQHPWRPFIDGYRQWRRPKLDGKTLPDIALACLKRN